MTEETLSQQYLNKLDPYFKIHRQIKGKHFSGKCLCIDAVLSPRNPNRWKRNDVAFGVEFKDTERFRRSYDTKNYTKWLAQCIDYSNTEWDDFGYLFIFCCPSLTDEIPNSVLSNTMFLNNFMGQLGIGEIKDNYKSYGLTILMHGSRRIWSEKNGVELGKTEHLRKKFGSRS